MSWFDTLLNVVFGETKSTCTSFHIAKYGLIAVINSNYNFKNNIFLSFTGLLSDLKSILLTIEVSRPTQLQEDYDVR